LLAEVKLEVSPEGFLTAQAFLRQFAVRLGKISAGKIRAQRTSGQNAAKSA
tara:strand:+ start:1181 stop:1333 length:153 start_codon:yes stop_codon:yes gene_type:complete